MNTNLLVSSNSSTGPISSLMHANNHHSHSTSAGREIPPKQHATASIGAVHAVTSATTSTATSAAPPIVKAEVKTELSVTNPIPTTESSGVDESYSNATSTLATSSAVPPGSSLHVSSDIRWIFSAEKIQDSPSRSDGMSMEEELYERQSIALIISDLGGKLKVNQLCINTAVIYMHRFYMIHSLKKFHNNVRIVATACLFFACKVEENPRRLKEFIEAVQLIFHKNNQEPANYNAEEFRRHGDEIVALESCLLQTLGFNVLINHAHTVIIKTCQMIRAPRDLAEAAYLLATNSLLLTNFCVKFSSEKVACFCLYLASKWTRLKIPVSSEGMQWYQYVISNINEQELEDISKEYLAIYDSCVPRIKKKLGFSKSQDTMQTSSVKKEPVDTTTKLVSQPRPAPPPRSGPPQNGIHNYQSAEYQQKRASLSQGGGGASRPMSSASSTSSGQSASGSNQKPTASNNNPHQSSLFNQSKPTPMPNNLYKTNSPAVHHFNKTNGGTPSGAATSKPSQQNQPGTPQAAAAATARAPATTTSSREAPPPPASKHISNNNLHTSITSATASLNGQTVKKTTTTSTMNPQQQQTSSYFSGGTARAFPPAPTSAGSSAVIAGTAVSMKRGIDELSGSSHSMSSKAAPSKMPKFVLDQSAT